MEIDRDFKLKRLHEFRTSIDKIKKIEDLMGIGVVWLVDFVVVNSWFIFLGFLWSVVLVPNAWPFNQRWDMDVFVQSNDSVGGRVPYTKVVGRMEASNLTHALSTFTSVFKYEMETTLFCGIWEPFCHWKEKFGWNFHEPLYLQRPSIA